MKASVHGVTIGLGALLMWGGGAAGSERYRWQESAGGWPTLAEMVQPPSGFQRIKVQPGGFAEWLRGLPMKPAGSPVRLFNGTLKSRQDVHAAVIDIDVGRRDLQQCADAIMRLRAEWLFGAGRAGVIAFNYTGGGRVGFARWARGERPSSDGKRWSARSAPDAGYPSFRRYLDQVFAYAGTYSLEKELVGVRTSRVEIGDVFVKGGFPGHAVLVVDLVEHPGRGERRFLLAQSFMPAQDMHILKSPEARDGSPWYSEAFSWPLATPEWTFPMGSHKRWPGQRAARAGQAAAARAPR